jgi:ketosteroid isomerase-like protein
MSLAEERSAFYRAHLAWGDNDLDAFMSYLAEDVVYVVNVDGLEVPYAASAVGKAEVRQRLQLLLDTFVVNAFVAEDIVHEPEFSRSRVIGYYKHKKTGERLDTKLRFHGWIKDGLLVRIEEYLDAAYVEAFQRFVMHLEAAAAGR